jgi:hypothetical protein
MMVWALLIQSSESLKCRQDTHRWLQISTLGGPKPPEEKEKKKIRAVDFKNTYRIPAK